MGNFLPKKKSDCDKQNPTCSLDIKTNKKKIGTIKIELRQDKVPKTVENFKRICKGQDNMKYKDSKLHRIIPGFMIQGGDYENSNGTGGKSIYGNKFDDENFELKHSEAGILSMANAGANTNGSQFFITTNETPWLNDRHVVFGKVVEGMDILKEVESYGLDSGKTKEDIIIDNCTINYEYKKS